MKETLVEYRYAQCAVNSKSKGLAIFLRKSVRFEGCRRLPESLRSSARDLFEELLPFFEKAPRKLDEKFSDFETLIANLYWASQRRRVLEISRNKNEYSSVAPKNISYGGRKVTDATRELVDIMANRYDGERLIGFKIGYLSRNKKRFSRTKIWLLPGLIKKIHASPKDASIDFVGRTNPVARFGHRVKVQSKKTGERARYTRYEESCVKLPRDVWECKKFLLERNSYHAALNIIGYKDGLKMQIHPYIYRRFVDSSWECLGRFFCESGGQQTFPKAWRHTITINGQKTVELDFKAIHPRLLYWWAGEEYTADAYLKILDFCPPCDAGLLRQHLKTMFNIAVNVRRETSARLAYEKWFEEDPEASTALQNIGLFPHNMLNVLKEAHPEIKSYFFSNKGVRLMYDESRITYHVMTRFHAEKRPCLPIHDSFIVLRDDEGFLRSVMTEASKRITGKEFPVERR